MDTTVITVEPADYGVGATDRIVFVDTKYTVTDDGHLHVYAEPPGGTLASFSKGTWRAVLRGGTFATEKDTTRVSRT